MPSLDTKLGVMDELAPAGEFGDDPLAELRGSARYRLGAIARKALLNIGHADQTTDFLIEFVDNRRWRPHRSEPAIPTHRFVSRQPGFRDRRNLRHAMVSPRARARQHAHASRGR